MKKSRKEKNIEIKESGMKKGKWAVWKTVISIIAGVAAVCGVTVLGVFLAGGFDEKIVYPEDGISFTYEGSLYNTTYGQIETCNDFQITIVSPTEGVTKNKVTLSFEGNLPTTKDNGYISNTIIRVPEVVTIGQPFTVNLLTDLLKDDKGQYILDDNGKTVHWIKGGISTLRADSEYNQISAQKLQIAVDTPVYKTETIVIDSTGQENFKIVTGESFTLKTKFIPSISEYMYSDMYLDREGNVVKNSNIGESEERVKRSFYEATGQSGITPIYDDKYTMHFLAGSEPVNEININSYTYGNAKQQLDFEATLGEITDLEYYNAMLVNLSSTLDKNKSSKASISIGEASIATFMVAKDDITMIVNQSTRFNIQENKYQSANEFIGAKVYSTSGALLDSMLANIAISFSYQGVDPTYGENSFVQVTGGEYIEIEGSRYYKPNTNVTDLKYSYWDIFATEQQTIQVYVALLVNSEDGITLFEKDGEALTYEIDLTISTTTEKPLSWANQADIDVMLTYNSDGSVKPQTIYLSEYVSIPENNTFKDAVFFGYFGIGEKEDLIETVDSIIGTSGYDLNRTGNYAVGAENLLLFALNGDSITLYNTGSFKLYFGTVTGQYNEDGTYNMAAMCNGYINVNCQKSLYSDSVYDGLVDVSNFQEFDGEISVDQGNDSNLLVSFIVNAESVPVFEDEFNSGYMSLEINDIYKANITSNFIVENETFTIDEETGEGILTYSLKVNEAVTIESQNGLYLDKFVLHYNGLTNTLTWTYQIPEELNICVYKPIAITTEIVTDINYEFGDIINGIDSVMVDKTLDAGGDYNLKISVTINDLTTIYSDNATKAFLEDILGVDKGYVVLTDQKGRTDTLAGKWHFAIKSGNSNVVEVSEDGQSLNFKEGSGEQIVIYIQSNDRNSSTIDTNNIKLIVNSVGVQSLKKDTSEFTHNSTTNESDVITDISAVAISKYGAKSTTTSLKLNELVKFYTDLEGTIEYKKIFFTLSTQYITGSSLMDDVLMDLFGQDGAVTLVATNAEGEELDLTQFSSATELRSALISARITELKINKNFTVNHTIKFIATDANGTVNTGVDLNILSNISISSESYPQTGTLYASEECEIINTVTNNNESSTSTFADLYDTKQYYVVYRTDRYVLTSEEEDNYIATFNMGKITFVDFWDETSKIFTVYFQPEGDNYFALNKSVTFVVTRNLKITNREGIFYVLGDTSVELGTFVAITRHDGVTPISGLSLEYVFDQYLVYDGNVKKQEEATFFFDYNVQELYTNLYVKLPDTENENALEVINVRIRPLKIDGQEDNIYKALADKFTLQQSNSTDIISATTRIYNDVEYMVVDVNNITWKFDTLNSYYIDPSTIDYYENANYLHYFSVIGSSLKETKVTFIKQKELLYGLENNSVYMPLSFKATDDISADALVKLHVPMIVSSIGIDQVVYDSQINNSTYALQYSLTKPEELLEKGIYNEIRAGELTQILSQITYGDTITKGGLYTLDGNTHKITFYPLDSTIGQTNESLIKSKVIAQNENDESYASLTLNHLPTEITDMYLAFEYTVTGSNASSQTFYYLLKIIPDVIVENSIYAYNGVEEHLTTTVSTEGSVDLDASYGTTTLHNGFKRFNVSKNITILSGGQNENEQENVISTFHISSTNGATLRLKLNGGDSYIVPVEKGTNKEIDGSALLNNIQLKVNDVVNVLIMSGDATIKYNDKVVLTNLEYKNEVYSITVDGGDTYYEQGDWSKYIEVYFSEDYSTMYYKPLISNKISLVIKHTYTGGSGDYDWSVIGGTQYYTFIINENSMNYSVRYIDGTTTINKNSYDWLMNNYGEDSEKDENGNIARTLKINLIENAIAGSSQSGTVIYNQMNVTLTKGIVGESGDIKSYEYDTATGNFTVTLNDYIDSDREIIFSVYTRFGYLGSLTIKLNANAGYAFKENKTNKLNGGTTTNFADIFAITKNGIEETGYTLVEAEISGDDAGFVTANSNGVSLEVADLIENKEVSITFEISFGENQTFVFTQDFILESNITPKTNIVSDANVIAGENHTIDITTLYSNTLASSTATITATSASPAFKELTGNTVSTNYVSEIVTVELNIEVTITYTTNASMSQKFNLTYSFTVYPSAELTTNYPNPTNETDSTKVTKIEYVDNETIFANIYSNFLNEKPIFNSSSTRLVMKSASISDNVVSYTTFTTLASDTNFLITVSDLKNASILNEATSTTHYSINSEIAWNSQIKFIRGTYSKSVYDDNGDYLYSIYNDSGIDSIVTLTITYQNVSTDYTIHILNSVLSVKLNQVTNNVSSGTYGTGATATTVNYETIYVDKTSTSSLFAEGRMATVNMEADISSYANTYYLIFEDKGSYYASYPIYFKVDDSGKTLNLDLGYSFAGKTFVGAYLTTAFETAGLAINNGSVSTTATVTDTVSTILATLNNYKTNLFELGELTLANRVQLVYAGNVNVDYSLYSDSLTSLTLSTETIDTIYAMNPLDDFNCNNGATNAAKTFTLNYYYKANIDIDVEAKATDSHNYIELEVNKEHESAAQLFGIIHPTNEQVITKYDFLTTSTTLKFEIIAYSSTNTDSVDTSNQTTIDSYLTTYKFSEFKNRNTEGDYYLRYTGLLNNGKYIYDYNLLPLGAQNTGDYQLTKITYTSGGFTKVFYVVVKIVPDYIVSFGGNQDNYQTETNGTVISNQNIDIVTVDSTDKYNFNITSSNTTEGYLSIKHKNGNNTTSELSTNNFTITLTKDQTFDGVEYNNTTNLTSKLFNSSDNSSKWTLSSNKYTLNSTIVSFANVPAVVFGDQYYVIEGVDSYNYKYKVYFMLKSKYTSPSSEETVSITEESFFDIGAKYEYLSIEPVKEDSTDLYINSEEKSPISDNSVTLITLQGIKAWLFDKETSAEQDANGNALEKYTGTYLTAKDINTTGGGYSIKTDKISYTLSASDQEYLDIDNLTLKYVTVEKIMLYDTNNNKIGSDINPQKYKYDTKNGGSSTAITTGYSLATADDLTGGFNGFKNRGVNGLNYDSDDSGNFETNAFKFPRLTDTSVYGNGNIANIKMVIRLKYEKGSDKEYYDCPVNVQVAREVSIEENKTVAIDGEKIDLSKVYNVKTGGNATTPSYINDTLEVIVDAYATAQFDMTLKSGETKLATATVNLSNSGTGYNKTQYISLSQYFERNVESGNTVEITNITNCNVYYITNNGDTIVDIKSLDEDNKRLTSLTLTISTITNDAVYVDHADMLNNGYYTINKYYIVSCTIGSTAFNYRATKTYYVTGKYYQMSPKDETSEIQNALNIPTRDSDGKITGNDTTTFENWASKAMVLKGLNAATLTATMDASADKDYLLLTVDPTTGASGNASVDSTGKITLNENWTSDQYINLIVKMKVSGNDRDITDDDDVTYVTLGTLRLGEQKVAYNITTATDSSSSATISVASTAYEGGIVTFTVTANTGYTVSAVEVKNSEGTALTVTSNEGIYTFTMPKSDVTIKVMTTAS